MIIRRIGLVIALTFLMTACATQPSSVSGDVPGFLWGLAHGITAPFALVGGLFLDVRIYAFPNSGWLYDLGFIIGLLPWAGGAAAR